MNKIALEITSEGWEITVIIDGKEYKEKYVATATGAKSIEGDFESDPVFEGGQGLHRRLPRGRHK